MLTIPKQAPVGQGQAFDPTGKTFAERLDAFLADVKKQYSLTVRRDSGRTVEWQQRLHICHMFLYNKYNSTKPAHTDKGERTISWSHLSDPKVVWATVKWDDILRTKSSGFPIKNGLAWKAGAEPDKEATKTRAKSILTSEKVGNNGQAMVSAGLKPCGEPCKCGAGRSNHLDGVAADLNTSDLKTLTQKLSAAKAGTIDDYLKKFGLHRPLANHPTSPEAWHIEAK